MSKEKNYIKIFNVTFGQIAYASFLICAVSGIFLSIPYDVSKPFESVSKLLLTDEGAKLIRSVHYWSSQFFLIFTILHFWDHLRLSTEKDVSTSVWFRLTITILFVVFINLSGFLLKGDSESKLAHDIFSSLLNKLPLIGGTVSYFILGTTGNLQIIYVHHIATFTIILLFFIVEHAQILTPSRKSFTILLIPLIIISFLLPPGLRNNFSSIVKSPWYLVGLQEIFHWLIYPEIFLLIAFLFLTMIFLIHNVKKSIARIIKYFLLISFFLYLISTIIGFYFRSSNWEFKFPWEFNPYENIYNGSIKNISDLFTLSKKQEINLVLNRYEGCLTCHTNVKGLSFSHSPETIGCSSCHLGNPFTFEKDVAHSGMVLIPGNLSNAKITCGNSQCHQQIVERVNLSLMNSMSGVVSVDKFVFDENDSINKLFTIQSLKYTSGDTHLRNLCASCHLSNEKTQWGKINQLSRGGGCNACHLFYSKKTEKYLNAYIDKRFNEKIEQQKKLNLLEFHPDLTLPNLESNIYCFGCHSRSGRISTNYEGWHESELTFLKDTINYRQLSDGRVFVKKIPDIHFEKGMLCIDCHTSSEIMGDGKSYSHKEQQVKIKCEDCHLIEKPGTKTLSKFDYESKKIAELRKLDDKNRNYLILHETGEPMVNTYLDGKEAYLIKKVSKEILKIKKPLSVCINNAHKNLSCSSCHTSWAPQCIGCHTEYNKTSRGYDLLANKEVKGEWIEHPKNFLSDYPSLGIKEIKGKKIIDNFIPGMIITIDKDKLSRSDKHIFKRLYAPAFSHTIRKESRSCESCHNNPVALGYGRGKLEYKINGNKGTWIFIPQYTLSKYDGLPLDAWIGFLSERQKNFSTRDYARPLTLEEQKKILNVGTCLTCHTKNSKVMKEALVNFAEVKKNITEKCILPMW